MLPLSNTPLEYAWGSKLALVELFGTEFTGAPQAELWFGTHPVSPAKLPDGADLASLVQLPFLVKLLAADHPLSLQVHPTIAQAVAGFEKEEQLGVALADSGRNYRDRNHKPEMLVALSQFRALSGLRPAAAVLAELAGFKDQESFAEFTEKVQQLGSAELIAWILDNSGPVQETIAALLAIEDAVQSPNLQAALAISIAHPYDPGILVSFLMNAVNLNPGEALFLPAGNLHAYLNGVGLELMAQSDNVVRAGMTSKHIDVPELLEILDPEVLDNPLFEPSELTRGVLHYKPAAKEFQLYRVSAEAGDTELPIAGHAIAIVMSGKAKLSDATGTTQVKGPGAWLLEGEEINIQGSADIFIATVQ